MLYLFFANYAAGSEYGVWKAFDINFVANDVKAPTIVSVTHIPNTRDIQIVVSDDVRVEKIEWYYNQGSLSGAVFPQQKNSTYTFTIPSHLIGATHIEIRVYDETGLHNNNIPAQQDNQFATAELEVSV